MSAVQPIEPAFNETWLCLKGAIPPNADLETIIRKSTEEHTPRIRCPRCHWQPTGASRWCCDVGDTPEPYFEGCRTVWNTFETRGRCPGCAHQWMWTTCHRCEQPSLHEHWYEAGDTGTPGSGT